MAQSIVHDRSQRVNGTKIRLQPNGNRTRKSCQAVFLGSQLTKNLPIPTLQLDTARIDPMTTNAIYMTPCTTTALSWGGGALALG